MGGVPVSSGENPIFGKVWFVDGTNGSDNSDGETPGTAFATIQAAITEQLASTSSLGDVIYVMPGTYAESATTTGMAKLQLIGAGIDSVIIAPTASHGLLVGADGSASSVMTNSAIRNIAFLTPSTSNTTYGALTIGYMTKSVIAGCKFKGTTNTGYAADATIGLQIGNRTDTAWEFHEHSRISNCEFTSNGGRTTELGYGILVGAQSAANPEQKGFKSMVIENNIISAYDTGILLNTGSSSCNGTVLYNNVITSQQGGNGPNEGIVSGSTDGTDALCMIVDNKITAISDCIKNFSACNCQGNIVSQGGATPDTEYFDGS